MSTLLLSGWSQPVDALSHLVDDGEVVLFDYSDYPNSAAAIEALSNIHNALTTKNVGKVTPQENSLPLRGRVGEGPSVALAEQHNGPHPISPLRGEERLPAPLVSQHDSTKISSSNYSIIAWSLGGQLALKAMLAGALKPRHLTLIAAPIQFVSEDAALPGMGAETYRLFRDSYVRDAARTKTRFHGLIAKGDAQMRRVIELLGHHPHVEDVSRFLPWLEELAESKLDVAGLANPPPTFMVHGMNDHIAPHAQSVALSKLLPTATLSSWANVGHAPHLHDAARLKAEIAAHRAQHGVAA